MSPSSISAHHQEEISKFLKFFRSRLKTHLENIDAEFEDTRSDRLSSDDVYSQKDVQDVLKSLCFAVKATTRCELQDTINMMALLLREIFVEAEDSKLALELDIAKVEDKDLLERVEKLGVAEWVEDPSAIAKRSSSKKAAVNPVAQRQLELEREKQSLEDEVRAARHTTQQQQEEHERELRKLQRKLADARARVEQLERQAEDAAQHVSQTPQFQSMKRMVAQKNQQLQELRRRLQRYEPLGDDDDDGGKNADDDD
ncbi:hypothetical protein P43SY_000720 [Pythium insidiosum]|uniref:Leucine zipper transcription factor-like protein 1 n=1 Tax=Pythium insidiosum TaxID=114742 RepID=A0AAD5LTA9_PYTIN|nr:hypothetical protein P43SY_000720 [Pythium insidiosum]